MRMFSRVGVVALGALIFTGGPLHVSHAQTLEASSPSAATDIYLAGQPGITAPRVVSEVKPQYTPAGLRGLIQGTVLLHAVVETDGSVSNVEVLKSLDRASGLDQAAVDALKQWRFLPGTREGKPARVRISSELSFTIRPPKDHAWPNGVNPAATTATVSEDVASGPVHLRMARPVEWKRHEGVPLQWIALESPDGLATVSVSHPQTGVDAQLPAEAVAVAVTDAVQNGLTSAGAERLAAGRVQSRTATFWVWSAFRTTVFPAGFNPDGAREMRLWIFAHGGRGKAVALMCTVLIPRAFEPGQADTQVRNAAEECSAIVDSIVIE